MPLDADHRRISAETESVPFAFVYASATIRAANSYAVSGIRRLMKSSSSRCDKPMRVIVCKIMISSGIMDIKK